MKRIVTLIVLTMFMTGIGLATTDAQLVQSVRDRINEAETYVQQFENGQINYLQLRVYTSSIRESVNRMIGNKHFEASIDDHFYEGLTAEDVEAIFGEPSDYTRWVWVENKRESTMLDEPIPRWEKVIYDGSLIKLTVNAWPHMLEFSDGTIVNYYFVGFDVRFKQQTTIDFNSIVNQLNASLTTYYQTYSNEEEVLDLMISYEQLLIRYIEENRGDCNDVMSGWFGSSNYMGEEKRVTWEVPMFTGNNLALQLNVNTCSDCEWPWVGMWMWIEYFNRPPQDMGMPQEKNREQYRNMNYDQVQTELDNAIGRAVSAAQTLDSGGSADFNSIMAEVQMLNDVLNEKMFEDAYLEETRMRRFRNRMNHLESFLSQYTDNIFKQERKESRYEMVFQKNETLHEERWCRHTNDVECESGYGCYSAECVATFGGDEQCANSIDDDNDGKTDCDDPDCDSDENCLCQRSQCWEQPNRECQIITGTSRGGADISKIAASKDESNLYIMLQMTQSTNPTEVSYNIHIWNGDLNSGYGIGYDSEGMWIWADMGEEIDTTGVEIAAGNVIEIKIPFSKIGDSNNFWIDASTTDRETWVNLDHTDKGVGLESRTGSVTIDGMPLDWENKPFSNDRVNDLKTKDAHCWCKEGWSDCDWDWQNGCESSQQCEWEIAQGCGWNQEVVGGECVCFEGYFDCDSDGNCESEGGCIGTESTFNEEITYVCNGIESVVPCDQRTQECGLNQHLDELEELCYCDEGWFDCNSDGDCLDTKACNMVLEICDNGIDDDSDGLIDCSDLQDCPGGTTCAFGVCLEGECTTVEDVYDEATDHSEAPEEPSEEEGVFDVPPEGPPHNGANLTATQIQSSFDTQISPWSLTAAAIAPHLKFVIAECTTDSDCGQSMGCDPLSGYCYCHYRHFDCNNDRSDGCESTDSTCGGRFDPCADQECKEHQTCTLESGYCECDEGYFDCDGDWENGCESQSHCSPCQTDADCAPDRCSPWGESIRQFGCYAGGSWYEESGRLSIGGTCEVTSDGQINGWIYINGWGVPYEELMRKKDMLSHGGKDWCEIELNNTLTERQYLQNSFNQEFMRWFFEDYVSNDAKNWQNHIGGIFDAYWRLVENTMRVAESMMCLEMTTWPSEWSLVNVSYDSPYGSIDIWEEWMTTDFFSRESKMSIAASTGASLTVPTPYMRAWIFPPKEVFKQEINKGPPEGEDKGPTPAEVQEMQNNTQVMSLINMISSWFGGSADFLFQVKDGEEVVFEGLMTINPEVIMQMKDDPGEVEPDLVMTASYDWFYNMVLTNEREFRGDQVESPPWVQRQEGFKLKDINTANNMVNQFIYAIRVGDIVITPSQYTFMVIQAMQGMSSLMGLAMS